jgi:hypothetical protein
MTRLIKTLIILMIILNEREHHINCYKKLGDSSKFILVRDWYLFTRRFFFEKKERRFKNVESP